jgi:hypothetical protein
MAKRITQTTFDEVVHENSEDFGMTKEESLADAIKQFTSQGVDLGSIDTTGGVGIEELEGSWSLVDSYTRHGSVSVASTVTSLQNLQTLCDFPYTYCLRNQNIFRSKGWLVALKGMIDPKYSTVLLVEVLHLLRVLMKTNTENRDCFEPHGSSRLCGLIKHFSNKLMKENTVLLSSAYKLSAVITRSETNKYMVCFFIAS